MYNAPAKILISRHLCIEVVLGPSDTSPRIQANCWKDIFGKAVFGKTSCAEMQQIIN